MFPEVHTSLRLDQRSFESVSLHINEQEDQLASFMVHHFISWAVKSGRPVVVVGLEQTVGHYHAVHLKIGGGSNLMKLRESGQLVFIEGLKALSQESLSDPFPLRKLCSSIQTELKDLQSPVVVIDKLSLLLNLGVTLRDVVALHQSLDDSVAEVNGCLIALSRSDGSGEDNDKLSAFLQHTCSGTISVWPLTTGMSSTVTGNLGFDWSGREDQGRFQFRLEDKNVRVFALGASTL